MWDKVLDSIHQDCHNLMIELTKSANDPITYKWVIYLIAIGVAFCVYIAIFTENNEEENFY